MYALSKGLLPVRHHGWFWNMYIRRGVARKKRSLPTIRQVGWPNQGTPTRKAWEIWRIYLKNATSEEALNCILQ
jgi:hypothetical protein